MRRLHTAMQKYAWGKQGSESKVVQLKKMESEAFEADEGEAYAELWVGTHPNGPSRIMQDGHVEGDESQGRCYRAAGYASEPGMFLIQLLETCPYLLGDQEEVGDLPFMLKVLSINKALSIQAHPDKRLAERLYATRPDLYKDDNHKPEMAVSLSDFEGLCGFRPFHEIVDHLKRYPELRAMVGEEAVSKALGCTSGVRPDEEECLRQLFRALVTTKIDVIAQQVKTLVTRLTKEEGVGCGEGSESEESLYSPFCAEDRPIQGSSCHVTKDLRENDPRNVQTSSRSTDGGSCSCRCDQVRVGDELHRSFPTVEACVLPIGQVDPRSMRPSSESGFAGDGVGSDDSVACATRASDVQEGVEVAFEDARLGDAQRCRDFRRTLQPPTKKGPADGNTSAAMVDLSGRVEAEEGGDPQSLPLFRARQEHEARRSPSASLCGQEEIEERTTEQAALRRLMLRLSEEYPGDIGIMMPLLLNYIRMGEGKSFFMAANEPHAYLRGDILEVMARSDNVVRVALTPKYRDVPLLCETLTYRMGAPPMVHPVRTDEFCVRYSPPVEDFEMVDVQVPPGGEYTIQAVPVASLAIVLSGSGTGCDGAGRHRIHGGVSLFIAARTALNLISGCGSDPLRVSLARPNLNGPPPSTAISLSHGGSL